ncbi:DNA translocase SftA [Halobacillus andaensis]|uniref:DNA translocase SftA n=1 Tax=Halobacillus andaensis TaxID=1176239 RepID=A0A917AX71_HALAA|nr:DNA translocase FtsK [Halobacillus andaensis]MBP2002812.1 S-DNA-T family DNA segregation ATPase FtsK/SpoIIIE [Halobacillus andaensis]GGF05894.1 DNA translocase SftA [Halobacillus andaensis]
MWNQFKNKFKGFFDDEQNRDYKESKQLNKEREHKELNANTKMTYRYPKQGNFRFPVIPDQSGSTEQTEQSERPVRRRERNKNQDRETSKPKHSQERYRYESQNKDKKEEELPETSSIPFTPTDVPSPVYGFHPRSTPATNYEKPADKVENTGKTARMEQSRYDEEHWQSVRQRVLGKIESSKRAKEQKDEAETEAAASVDFEVEEETPTEEIEEQRTFQDTESPFNSEESVLKQEEETHATEEIEEQRTFQDTENPFNFEESVLKQEEEVHATEEIEEQRTFQDTENPFNFEESVLKQEEEAHATEEIEEQHPFQVTETSDKPGEIIEKTEREVHTNEQVEDGSPVLENSREEKGLVEQKDPKEEDNETKRESRPSFKEKKVERKSVPFNVVMTPRDKRSRDQQKKTLNKGTRSHKNSNDERFSERPLQQATPLHLLNDKNPKSSEDEGWVRSQMELLENTLRQFHVRAKVVHAMKGPAVTRFEVQPEPGVKVSKITNLADDIKLSMAARDIRIEAPIPGKQAVGIEVPNRKPEMVGLQEIFASDAFIHDSSPLSVGLGLDIGGDSVVTNLKKMPHGLIAGATGSGKSVCINTILISLLYKAHYDDVKFLLIDPKMVELAPYNGLPHLVSPVITDVKAATSALKWAVKEMEERYEKFVAEGARDVERYNEKMIQQGRRAEKLPYLVIVIDELADLMMVSPQDVEDAICRIAQKARACGIHLLLATQRPSVDVITGLIKANIPTRIAFSVSSQVDSRTIIDTGGAEKLLGKGDMLFIENGAGQSVRIQGAFVSDDEIERVTNYVKKIAPPNYLFEQEELIKQVSNEEATDELFEQAVQFVMEQNGASASLLQRRFKVGYNRAARLIDQMADYGIISEAKGSKPRDVLLTPQQVEDMMV